MADKENQEQVQNGGGSLKGRLPFGLCDKHNIKLPKSATPRDAWDALKGKGINPDAEYKRANQNIKNNLQSIQKARPKKRITGLEAEKAMAQEHNRWKSGLTIGERDSIRRYTDLVFDSTNEKLRKGIDPQRIGGIEKRIIYDMDKAIANFELKQDIQVHRGTSVREFGVKNFDELKAKIGKEHELKGYSSTSTDLKEARDFASEQAYDPVVMHIDVPKGKGRGAFLGDVSKYPKEKEFTLKRGAKIRIKSVEMKSDGIIYARVEMIE